MKHNKCGHPRIVKNQAASSRASAHRPRVSANANSIFATTALNTEVSMRHKIRAAANTYAIVKAMQHNAHATTKHLLNVAIAHLGATTGSHAFGINSRSRPALRPGPRFRCRRSRNHHCQHVASAELLRLLSKRFRFAISCCNSAIALPFRIQCHALLIPDCATASSLSCSSARARAALGLSCNAVLPK